jgi:hypothetical protein
MSYDLRDNFGHFHEADVLADTRATAHSELERESRTQDDEGGSSGVKKGGERTTLGGKRGVRVLRIGGVS